MLTYADVCYRNELTYGDVCYRNEFRTNTRPLWYEELAQFFHISINEAAEALGMCMSAIKKICRRHGITRWPHRKLASVNKTVAMLQSKINTAEDDGSRAALRSEAVNVLTMKLRLTINPSYLVRDESVLLQPQMSTGAPNIPGGAAVPVLPGGGMDMGNAPGGGPAGGFPAGMGVDVILRQQAEQSRALQAQEAALMLQKVQSMAHGRVGMPGMGMAPHGAYGGGGPMGLHLQQNMMRGPQPGGGPGGRGLSLSRSRFSSCLPSIYFCDGVGRVCNIQQVLGRQGRQRRGLHGRSLRLWRRRARDAARADAEPLRHDAWEHERAWKLLWTGWHGRYGWYGCWWLYATWSDGCRYGLARWTP